MRSGWSFLHTKSVACGDTPTPTLSRKREREITTVLAITSDTQLPRHVLRLDAGEAEALDEPFAHLADAAVVVDPHRQEIAPALVLLAPHRHAARDRHRGRGQDLVGAEVRILGDRGQPEHQRVDHA